MNARTLTPFVLAVLLATFGARAESLRRPFQDCDECPRMIALPGGSATLGSPADEPERHGSEPLQYTARIVPFAVSETEITRAQFATFVAATKREIPVGCYTHGDGMDSTSDLDAVASWRAPRFEQTDDHPVVCITWQDATDYAAWLSRKTGQVYRLLSDAEWEYAARGGTVSAYFWGTSADSGCAYMNGGDRSLGKALPQWLQTIRRDRAAGSAGARVIECDDGSAFTSAVRRYQPNAFGLYDVAGNVWEWTENCRDPPGCSKRSVRGGSWDDWPMELRSADRHQTPANTRRNDQGFRVARAPRASE
jgi:formylglycine-generating enzyme